MLRSLANALTYELLSNAIYFFVGLWFSQEVQGWGRSGTGTFQWWKRRRLVCTRAIPSSVQALMTTSSAVEPDGAAMYSTPLCGKKYQEV